MKSLYFTIGVCSLLTFSLAQAKQSKLDLDEPYLLLATSTTSSLQKELAEAVAAGYRVATAWSGTESGELLVLVEKQQPPQQRELKLVAALRLETLEAELKAAGAEGFRLLPRGLLVNPMLSGPDGEEIVLPLARASGSTETYEYMIETVTSDYNYVPGTVALTGTLDKAPLQGALRQAARTGYNVVGLVSRSKDVEGPEIAGVEVHRVRRVEYILIAEKKSGTPKPHAGGDRYRLVAGAGASLQNALNEGAAAGYRLFLTTQPPPPINRPESDYGEGGAFEPPFPEVVLVMEKLAEPSDTYMYRIMHSAGPTTLRYQMTSAATRGYRPYPGAAFSNPLTVVMERAPGEQAQHDYVVLETRRTSTMEDEVIDSSEDGFVVIGGGLSQQNQHLVILEKSLEARAEAATPPVLFPSPTVFGMALGGRPITLKTRKTETMEKELNEAASEGYRILATATPAADPILGGELSLTLVQLAALPTMFEYVVLGTTRMTTLQKELNEAATKGYRLMPATMLLKKSAFRGTEVIAIMEKEPAPQSYYEYAVIDAVRESTLEKEIAKLMTEGYEIVASANRENEHLVLLERLKPLPDTPS